MMVCVLKIAAFSGANMVTPFPGMGVGGIVQQWVMSRLCLMELYR